MSGRRLRDLPGSGALVGTEKFYADNGSADVRVTADQIKEFSDLESLTGPNVKDYGAVGDGATDDTDAFYAAADDGTFFVPEGTYATNFDFFDMPVMQWWGRGIAKVTLNAGGGSYNIPGNYCAIASPPDWDPNDPLGFGGDPSNILLPIFVLIGDAITPPATGYATNPNTAATRIQCLYYGGANAALGDADGRTGYTLNQVTLVHHGQGDASGWGFDGIVTETLPGSTQSIANPAVIGFNGTLQSNVDGAAMNGAEFHFVDNGYDAGGAGFVAQFSRTNATGAKDIGYQGMLVASSGTQPIDLGYNVFGPVTVGFSAAGITGGVTAFAAAAGHRFNCNSTFSGAPAYRVTVGDAFFSFETDTDCFEFTKSLIIGDVPTSAAGLPSGAIWRDAGASNVLKMVP